MPFSANRRGDQFREVRGLRATASAALLVWGLTWTVGVLHAAPAGHVEPRRPTPVTGKVSVDAPPAVSTAVQVPAPAHMPAAPYDLQAPPPVTGSGVGVGATVKPNQPTPVQAAVRSRDVPRETSGKVRTATSRQQRKHVTAKADSERAATSRVPHQGAAATGDHPARKSARSVASAKSAQSASHVTKHALAKATPGAAPKSLAHGAGKGARAETRAAKSGKAAQPAKVAKASQMPKVRKTATGKAEVATRAAKSGKGGSTAKAGVASAHRRAHPHGA